MRQKETEPISARSLYLGMSNDPLSKLHVCSGWMDPKEYDFFFAFLVRNAMFLLSGFSTSNKKERNIGSSPKNVLPYKQVQYHF